MKRVCRTLVIAALSMLCALPATAQVVVDGTVTCSRTVTQPAAAGGRVATVSVQVGDLVDAGAAAATLSADAVYAPCDGTVEIIFADEGESADSATSKYGGVMTLVPENQYMIYATSEYAYKSVRTSRITTGQTVFMKCTADGSHRGTGVITQIDGEIFYVEATGGTFYNGETVYLYMESDYGTADRLGKGTVVATAARAVPASGDVMRLCVEEGDFVEKGQLLFETLGALPDGGGDDALVLSATLSGYVTAVYAETNAILEKGAPLIAVCPAEALVVSAQVPEADLSAVRAGGEAAISFELPEETLRAAGKVLDISYLPMTDANGGVGYEVRIAFDADPRIAPGMTATVSIG